MKTAAKLAIVSAAGCALVLVWFLWLKPPVPASIGIIGSADGPTVIFVSKERWPWIVSTICAGIAVVAAVVAIVMRRRRSRSQDRP